MINKIIASTLFVFMLFALALSLMGVEHVELSDSFVGLLNRTNYELNTYNFKIPDIPTIPEIPGSPSGFTILSVVNAILRFLNGLITLLNFVVMAVNTIISLIEFVVIIIKNIIIFRDELVS